MKNFGLLSILVVASAPLIATACGKDNSSGGGDGDGDISSDGGTSSGGIAGNGDGGTSSGGIAGTGDGGMQGGGEGGENLGGQGGMGGGSGLNCEFPDVEDEGACRPVRVLVLSDFDGHTTEDTNSITTYLGTTGLSVTAGPYYAAWDGATPSLAEHDVLLALTGYDYGSPFTTEAGSAIKAFVAAGGGFIMTEWTVYDEDPDEHLDLLPVTYADDYEYGPLIDTANVPGHPLLEGITLPYQGIAGYSFVTPVDGATVVLSETGGQPILTYMTSHGGTTIHINHDAHYTVDPVVDTDLLLFRNAAYFAGLPN